MITRRKAQFQNAHCNTRQGHQIPHKHKKLRDSNSFEPEDKQGGSQVREREIINWSSKSMI